MTIPVTCPSCGKVLEARESAAGQQAYCPGCGDVIQIPELPVVSPTTETVEAEVVDGESSALDLANEEAKVPGTADRVPCPVCGEMIVKGAVKCRFCGELLGPGAKSKSRTQSGRLSDVDEMTTSDWIIAIVCPGIGCIGGVIYMIQGKPKGGKILGISLVAIIFHIGIRGVLTALRHLN